MVEIGFNIPSINFQKETMNAKKIVGVISLCFVFGAIGWFSGTSIRGTELNREIKRIIAASDIDIANARNTIGELKIGLQKAQSRLRDFEIRFRENDTRIANGFVRLGKEIDGAIESNFELAGIINEIGKEIRGTGDTPPTGAARLADSDWGRGNFNFRVSSIYGDSKIDFSKWFYSIK
jgi:hypothetical protein